MTDKFKEWLDTQPDEIRREFDEADAKQRQIDGREMPVSQIYYGNKPINPNAIYDLLYTDRLTHLQRQVLTMISKGKTQLEISKIIQVSRPRIANIMAEIRKKAKKTLFI